MERGLIMLLHAILIGIVIYIAMVFFGYNKKMSENRSILIASILVIYMILFGHGWPKSLNKNV